MIPGTLGYVYLGFTGTEIVTGGENIIQTILILIAILVTVMYLPHYIKKVSKMSKSID